MWTGPATGEVGDSSPKDHSYEATRPSGSVDVNALKRPPPAPSIVAVNAAIGGRMYGNVFASGKIELQRGSQLLGDIRTRGLVIEDGVVFQGNCQMGDVVDPPVRRRDESEPGLDEVAVDEEEYEDADL